MKQHHPQLGELMFDFELVWWEGAVVLESGSRFTLYVNTPSDFDHSITDTAVSIFEKMKSLEEAARKFAADELLPIQQKVWSLGAPVDAPSFMRRLTPSALQIWPDGDAEFSFGDDDLFWGHEIGIRYSGGRFIDAVVQG